MKKINRLPTVLTLVLLFGCSHADTGVVKQPSYFKPINGEAKTLQSWQGDYPVAQINLLSEMQREQAIGFITDAKTFRAVWKAFKPGEAVPEIDFTTYMVLFARNTQFYNRISIGKVSVKDGVAEVLAMETMSAVPIEDRVAMSLVVVASEGINGLRVGNGIINISD